MKEITKAKFLELYEAGLLFEVVSINNRVYARTPWDMGDKNEPYQVVYAELTP